MNAIVNALSAENERKSSADQAETPRLQENLRKLVKKQNLQGLWTKKNLRSLENKTKQR